jgi:phosphonate transport system substrate-binding protein
MEKLRMIDGRVAPAKSRIGAARPILCWLFAAIAMLCAFPNSSFAGHEPVRARVLGFLPILSTEMLVRRFEPLADYLAREIGVPIVLETAPSFAVFVRRTNEEQRYDYLFTAPHFYFLAQRRAGYRVVARVDGEPLRSVIVARRDSGISEPWELCGKTISTPDAMALVTIMVRQRLIEAGCDIDGQTDLVATPSHNASLFSAYRHASDAAGIGTIPYARADANVRSEMRVVAETGGTLHMPFGVAPWISDEEAAMFANALIDLTADSDGLALLEHLGWPAIAGASAEEYDVFEGFASVVDE